MTVVRNLPEQLILAHAPWLMGGFLIVCIIGCLAAGLALLFSGELAGLWTVAVGALIPLALFAGLIKRDQVIFDGPRGHITLQRRTLWRYEQKAWALQSFARAEVQTISDTARPVLHFQNETLPCPLVEAYTTGGGAQEAVAAITGWHQNWMMRQ